VGDGVPRYETSGGSDPAALVVVVILIAFGTALDSHRATGLYLKNRQKIAARTHSIYSGTVGFMDYTLRIERPLLCPRPETEELVDLVLQDMKKNPETFPTLTVGSRRRVFDIGCGTGCIGIALAAADSDSNSDILSVVTAIDVEPVAVKLAAENAALILGPAWRDRYRVTLDSVEDYQVTNGAAAVTATTIDSTWW
jgi:SAM-dependent methyltransferase